MNGAGASVGSQAADFVADQEKREQSCHDPSDETP
jgi:hypothetical protein